MIRLLEKAVVAFIFASLMFMQTADAGERHHFKNLAEAKQVEILKNETRKAVPDAFKQAESGSDGQDIFAIYKKSPQEVISVNLRSVNDMAFDDVETLSIDGRKTIFFYAGTQKNGFLVVTLNNNAGYFFLGYNKPYMGDDIVKKDELLQIARKMNLSRFE